MVSLCHQGKFFDGWGHYLASDPCSSLRQQLSGCEVPSQVIAVGGLPFKYLPLVSYPWKRVSQ